MNGRALILSAAVGGAVFAFVAARQLRETSPDAGETADQGGGLLSTLADSLGFVGVVRVSAMRDLDAALLSHSNIRAMLAVIRRGEGTAGAAGYRTLFGGGLFEGFADHPRINVCRTLSNGKKLCSTAAGAYQFLASSWDETRAAMGLADFSPASQDFAAVGRMAARGALNDVLAGRLESAFSKLAYEWASLPGSPYGQPVISMDTARAVYLAAGGLIPGVVVT